jgi:hypothetical protein
MLKNAVLVTAAIGLLALAQRLSNYASNTWAIISAVIAGLLLLTFAGLIVKDTIRPWWRRRQLILLHTVAFDYLPVSPLERDWTKAYTQEGEVLFETDPAYPGSLHMTVKKSFVAIHHQLPHHASLSTTVRYKARFIRDTMIFTGIDVASKDGTQRRRVWIKFYHGKKRFEYTGNAPAVDSAKELPEQTVWLPGKIRDGWIEFDISLPDAVQFCLGGKGWVYQSIWAFRIRGDVSISPIQFLGRN